jgi:hypothetical protein
MKKPFDLYKWIIIGSLVVMPAAGGWLYWLNQKILEGEKAIAQATRPVRGDLSTIGRLLQEIKNQEASAGTASAEDPGVYFDRMISRASDGTLKRNDYKIDPVGAPPHRDTKSIDRLYKMEFKSAADGKQYALSRPLVQAILFMIEANSPAWRLRSLTLRNETTGAKQMRTSGIKPPPEIDDNWFVDEMTFARREPDTNLTRRGR